MTDGDRFWSTHEGRVALAWFAFLLGREALSPLLPTLIDSLSIGGSEAGLLLPIMWITYALSQYPSCRLSDQLTRKTVIITGLSVATLGFLTIATMQTFGGVPLAVGMIGLSGGAFFTSNHGLLSDLFVECRGQAFGIQVAAGSLGSARASGLAILALWVGSGSPPARSYCRFSALAGCCSPREPFQFLPACWCWPSASECTRR